MYPDDEVRFPPSSDLSTASAASSTMGSPLSHPGQPAALSDWGAPHALNASPGIVDHNDFFPGADMQFPGHVESFIELPQPKPIGYVGKFPTDQDCLSQGCLLLPVLAV